MKSIKYKMRKAILDLKTCFYCRMEHGKIYEISELINQEDKSHNNCRCTFELLKALQAGTATKKGINGADWWLKYTGKLPNYYITKEEATNLGWKAYLGNLNQVAYGKMLTNGIYKNRNGHLHVAEGRVWYEADINYNSACRNDERIIFSNDGLIFVTYDHYLTFQEIV